MHVPDMFAVTDKAEIDRILSGLALGCIVTRDDAGFFGTHIPMMFDAERRVLTGHLSRGNPHPQRCGDGEALAIFQGLDAYITPNWYPSKFEHGKAVPTWNYEVVHVAGRLSWREEMAWLRAHLDALTDRHERGQAKPWEVADAPADYLDKLLRGIIGLELDIREVKVKRKFSQNRAEPDRLGVIAGLTGSDDPAKRLMARAISEARSRG